MPYRFTFDLTKVSKRLFNEIMLIADNIGLHRRIGRYARLISKKLRIHEITGLNISDAIQLIEDFIEIQIRNIKYRKSFLNTRRRALFLPHCSRKYMDKRCEAYFDPTIPSYVCRKCSSDCLIRRAVELGEEKGYDVYILPGGSCIKEILESGGYEAVVGVACGMEIKLANKILNELGIPGQAVPLVKNGCAYTVFNLDYLKSIL
mgnify:CR=1 FL=1